MVQGDHAQGVYLLSVIYLCATSGLCPLVFLGQEASITRQSVIPW